MRRLLYAALFACLFAPLCHADTLTKAETQAQIEATIKANGQKAITGPILQTDLLDMLTITASWQGAWASNVYYSYGEIVTYNGSTWFGDAPVQGVAPGTTDGQWTLFSGTPPGETPGRLLIDQGADANPAFEVMSGDGTLAANGALTLATSGVTAGTYGDGTHSTQVTFDAKGRATSASSVTITHASGDLPLGGGTMSGNIAMGGNSVTGASNLSGSTLSAQTIDAPEVFNATTVFADAYHQSGDPSDCAEMQRAVDALGAQGGDIYLQSRTYNPGTCQIVLNGGPVRWIGAGWSDNVTRSGFPAGTGGTIINITDTTESLFLSTSGNTSGLAWDHIEFSEASIQATPASGWTPVVVPPVVSIAPSSSSFSTRVSFYDDKWTAVYAGVYALGSGRVEMHFQYGQVWSYLFKGDENYDTDRIDQVHIWPYWSNSNYVYAWQQQNTDAILLGRVDTPFIDHVFCINCRSAIHFTNFGNGVSTRFQIPDIQADGSKYGVWIDSTASNIVGHIGTLDAQHVDNTQGGTVSIAGSASLQIDSGAVGTRLQINQIRSQLAAGSVIDNLGTSSSIDIKSMVADQWGNDGGSEPLVNTSNGSPSSAVNIGYLSAATLVSNKYSNATTDYVNYCTPSGCNYTSTSNAYVFQGMRGIFVDSGANLNLQSGTGFNVIFGPIGSTGVAVNSAMIYPQADNALNSGAASLRWGTVFTHALNASGTVTLGSLSTAGIVTNTSAGVLGTEAVITTASGGLGANNSGASGVPIFASGVVSMATLNASGGIPQINGTPTVGNCLKWSATGIQDAGATCGGGTGSPGGSTGAIQYNTGSGFGGITVASGDLMAGGGTGAPTDTGVPIFIGTGDGTTNNYTAFQASCNAGGAYIPAGTYVIDLLSATTLCTPPAGTVFRGAGQGKTTLKFVAADTSQVNVFNINANKIDFKDMTIQIIPPTGGTMILYNMQNADGLNLINDEISSNAVEGLTISGTATAGDTLNVAFLHNGTTTTVSTTVTSGQTTAQMATAVAAAINANGTVSGWGAVATASGSFVGIAQPDSLTPQASYTLSVTGSATETLTAGFSNTTAVFNNQTNGDEADDVLVQNVYMHDLLYNVLKSNTSTQTNKRWSFRGGNYDRVFAGFVNINSPGGTFSTVDVDGISGEATGLNYNDALPIAASNVQNMTVRGVRLSGTYDQNVFHFEEGSSVATSDDMAYVATSGNAGVGYSGTCLYVTDNDVGGTYKGVTNSSFGGITCTKLDGNSQGYGAWIVLNSVSSDRDTLTDFHVNGWPGCVNNAGFQHFILGPLDCTNFGASTGTTAITNTQATGVILNFMANNYATGLSNTGNASRPSSCTGTTC